MHQNTIKAYCIMEQQYHRSYTSFAGSSVGFWLPEHYQQGTVWELELG